MRPMLWTFEFTIDAFLMVPHRSALTRTDGTRQMNRALVYRVNRDLVNDCGNGIRKPLSIQKKNETSFGPSINNMSVFHERYGYVVGQMIANTLLNVMFMCCHLLVLIG